MTTFYAAASTHAPLATRVKAFKERVRAGKAPEPQLLEDFGKLNQESASAVRLVALGGIGEGSKLLGVKALGVGSVLKIAHLQAGTVGPRVARLATERLSDTETEVRRVLQKLQVAYRDWMNPDRWGWLGLPAKLWMRASATVAPALEPSLEEGVSARFTARIAEVIAAVVSIFIGLLAVQSLGSLLQAHGQAVYKRALLARYVVLAYYLELAKLPALSKYGTLALLVRTRTVLLAVDTFETMRKKEDMARALPEAKIADDTLALVNKVLRDAKAWRIDAPEEIKAAFLMLRDVRLPAA